jgi:dipeptidyl aminopeptidase/acylaminoacyl peptidase
MLKKYRVLLPLTLAALALLAVLLVGTPTIGRAAFPGANGKIAFVRAAAAPGVHNGVYVASEGGTELRLTDESVNADDPMWSSDGSRIAYVQDSDIWVMNADGSGKTNLTNTPHDGEYEPAWSPDGHRIAFQSGDGSGPCTQRISVMNADGTGRTGLTDFGGGCDLEPAWSPDGTRLVFWRHLLEGPGGNDEIYMVNADGTGETNLTSHPASDQDPVWSPDGTKIAFASDRDGSYNFEIYTMNPDGTGLQRLTNNPNIDDYPAWSPDGTKIVFSSSRDGNLELYVMNADGSGQTRVTTDPRPDLRPDWQPLAPTPTPTPSPTLAPASLTAPAIAGATEVQVSSTTGFAASDHVLINPGGANQEANQITGFGSLILATPLQFSHQAGESVVKVALFSGVWGDIDCSGTVSIGDAQKTARSLIGLSVSQGPSCPQIGSHALVGTTDRIWGDVDCGGAVTIGDAQKIARSLIGLSVSQGSGCVGIGQPLP